MKIIRPIIRMGRKFRPTWRYLFNLAPTAAYLLERRKFSGEAARVLEDLNRDGVAITSAKALLGVNSCFGELSAAVERLQGELSDQLAKAREGAASAEQIGQKTFLVEYLGRNPSLDLESAYARFALQGPILGIANAYIGMFTRLRHYNVWHTFATRSQPRESQLWHRDREDHYILKAFVFLSDIDEGAGPFTYVPRTHAKGGMRCEPASFVEADGVRRSDDAQMAEVVPRDRWIKAMGPAGTIVFADTRGYHKGGEARERDRIMYTCMFTSPASESRELFRRPEQTLTRQNLELSFAVAPPRRGPWLTAGRQ